MPNEQPPQISIPAGHVTITTYGSLRMEMVQSLMDARATCDRTGLHNVAWNFLPGTLIEKARNEAVRALLRDPNAQWLLQIDGDMTFAPDSVIRILQTAYGEMPHADAVGAYCPLRGELALPTLDTGSGTWESIFPGSGILEVIRTGAAFLLVKRHVFENLRDPWFRMRVPARPLDFLAEVDNFARCKFDGRNPFRGMPGQEWERLEKCAIDDPSSAPETFVPAEVGEDSGWCDRMRNAGFRIFVNTDIVTGHVDTKITSWQTHKEAIAKIQQQQRYVVGLGA